VRSCAATVQEALPARRRHLRRRQLCHQQSGVEYDAAQTNVGSSSRRCARRATTAASDVTFGIVDLHYAPSVAPLERSLSRVNGVIRAVANQATETGTVDYIPGVVSAQDPRRRWSPPASSAARLRGDPLERERIARSARSIRSPGNCGAAAVAVVA